MSRNVGLSAICIEYNPLLFYCFVYIPNSSVHGGFKPPSFIGRDLEMVISSHRLLTEI